MWHRKTCHSNLWHSLAEDFSALFHTLLHIDDDVAEWVGGSNASVIFDTAECDAPTPSDLLYDALATHAKVRHTMMLYEIPWYRGAVLVTALGTVLSTGYGSAVLGTGYGTGYSTRYWVLGMGLGTTLGTRYTALGTGYSTGHGTGYGTGYSTGHGTGYGTGYWVRHWIQCSSGCSTVYSRPSFGFRCGCGTCVIGAA